MNPIRTVLVADDHPAILAGLAEIIKSDSNLHFIGFARNGVEARDAYLKFRPDVLLMDLQMPVVGGLESIREIRTLVPDARIAILTSFDGEEDIERGLRDGAKAYVLKDAPPETILQCIHAVAAGRRFLSNSVAQKLVGNFDANRLSTRELEILRLVLEGNSNKVISRIAGISNGTTKFHLKNIFAKLGAKSRTQAITIAQRRGIFRA